MCDITSKGKQGFFGLSLCPEVFYAASPQRNPQSWRAEIAPKSLPHHDPNGGVKAAVLVAINKKLAGNGSTAV